MHFKTDKNDIITDTHIELELSKKLILDEFQKIMKENPLNFDKEYLSQIDLKITNIVKKTDGYNDISYQINGFDYENNYDNTCGTDSNEKGIAKTIYYEIVMESDLMKKDPEIRKYIDEANAEAKEIVEDMNRKKRKKFWGWARPMVAYKYHIGDCHIIWSEQKRILKEKYNINWKTPAERNPNVKFD